MLQCIFIWLMAEVHQGPITNNTDTYMVCPGFLACKQYMDYEQETLERVVRARAGVEQAREGGDVAALGVAEASLGSSLTGLFALAENYPELKADQSFGQLQTRM